LKRLYFSTVLTSYIGAFNQDSWTILEPWSCLKSSRFLSLHYISYIYSPKLSALPTRGRKRENNGHKSDKKRVRGDLKDIFKIFQLHQSKSLQIFCCPLRLLFDHAFKCLKKESITRRRKSHRDTTTIRMTITWWLPL
jgi:hypothetical protein